MTVTLDLKPEVEERINAEAKARGMLVEEYIQLELEGGREIEAANRKFITGDDKLELMESTDPNALPYEEWLQRWNEWLSSHDYIKAPPLSDEAISRESIYREREDKQL